MISNNKENLPLKIKDHPEETKPKPSIVEQGLVLGWLYLVPILLIYLLYRFRKSYKTHSIIYILICIIVIIYILLNILIMTVMSGTPLLFGLM